MEFTNPGFEQDQQEKIAQFASEINYSKDKILLSTANVAETITNLLDYAEKTGHPIKNLSVRKPTLEDVFLKLTGKELADNV